MATSPDVPASLVVGVPTYRRPVELGALLPQLLTQTADLPGRRTRVLVVDNDPEGSAAGVVEAARDDRVRYAHQPVPGIAAVRNRILDVATDELGADLVAMIDDDERPEPGWLAALVETQERTGAALVAGRVVPEFTGLLDPWVAAGEFHTRYHSRRNLPDGAAIDVAAAGNLLLDLRQVRALGQRFDERVGLAGGEDTLFSRELHARGASLVWCPGSVAVDRVLPERMTRRWVLVRQMSHGDAGIRAELRLASGSTARATTRVRALLGGSARAVVGGARAAVGVVTRRPVDQARGLRTVMRGIGMVRAALGLHHVEYARQEPGAAA